MLNVRQILVSAMGLAIAGVGLTACGQKGALYMPTDPMAKERSTLPGLLLPTSPAAAPVSTPASAAADTAVQPPAAASSAPAGAAR